MTARKLRVPMFFKFLIGCLALAAMLIIGGTFVVRNETRLRSRGNYLQKQDQRLAKKQTSTSGDHVMISRGETARASSSPIGQNHPGNH